MDCVHQLYHMVEVKIKFTFPVVHVFTHMFEFLSHEMTSYIK